MEGFYKKWFLPLALPAILLFAFVIFIPFVIGVFYSFTAWRGTYFLGAVSGTATQNPFEAVNGIINYTKAFNTARFINAFIYTVKFTVIAVIAVNIIGLAFAMVVTQIKKGAGIFRTIYFMPNLLGGLALGYIWGFIFEIVFSKIFFGPDALNIPFLTNMTQDNTKALFALAIMLCWQSAGYMMIIYINGINNIPEDLYEAARIDGANATHVFRVITVPMLMPAFTIVFFLTLSGCFKLLDQNIALTDGKFDTRMLAMQILRTTQDTSPPNYGLAQAQAVIFFVLIATVSLLQVYLTKKREVEA
jgi:raffinose/stachyose/melibiose transport system permease protein